MTSSAATPGFHLLVAVWGEPYIATWLEFGMGALLAEGNLPALAAEGRCRVTFLCRAGEAESLLSAAAALRAAAMADLDAMAIDDLLSSVPGVTLTRAFARGMERGGLGPRYVFMNADFVLAGGTLRALAATMETGVRAVAAASMRCDGDQVAASLRLLRGDDGRLAAPASALAALALRHPHPTVAASMVEQKAVHHAFPNQFFWRAGDHALVGHFFLLFPLALQPTLPVGEPPGYCDYVFLDHYAPGEAVAILNDHPACFLLELQARRHEISLLRLGAQTPARAGAHLAAWTAACHRRYGLHPVVIGEAEEAQLADARSRAGAFMAALSSHLGAPPVAHTPTWRAACRAAARETALRADWVGLLSHETGGVTVRLRGTPFHHEWLDQRVGGAAIDHVLAKATRALTVVSGESAFDRCLLAHAGRVERRTVGDMTQLDAGGFDALVCILADGACARLGQVLGEAAPLVAAGAPVAVICHLRDPHGDAGFEATVLESLVALPDLTASIAVAARGPGRVGLLGSVRRLTHGGRHHRLAAALLLPVILLVNGLAALWPDRGRATAIAVTGRLSHRRPR